MAATTAEGPQPSSSRRPATDCVRALPPAKLGLEHERTLHGQVLGTPSYMAPEQAEGSSIRPTNGPTFTVWERSSTRFSRVNPRFTPRAPMRLLKKVRRESPAPPRQVNSEVAPALQAICLKALSKAPEERYDSAADLAQEVQCYLADEPVQAYPEPWTRHAARWARKHRTVVTTAACLLVAATAALSISTVLIARRTKRSQCSGRASSAGRQRHVYEGCRELAGGPATLFRKSSCRRR